MVQLLGDFVTRNVPYRGFAPGPTPQAPLAIASNENF